MLILSRKKNQKLVITTEDGTEVVVTLCGTKGDYAKLGIDAPESIGIRREELLTKRK